MGSELIIHLQALREGKVVQIEETVSSSFLQVEEPDLSFSENIRVIGEAYLADSEVILHIEAFTEAKMACSICNKIASHPIHVPFLYHAVPVHKIHHGIFDYSDLVREDILLECPLFGECNQGNCSEREGLRKYLKKSSSDQEVLEKEEVYQPFAGLTLEKLEESYK